MSHINQQSEDEKHESKADELKRELIRSLYENREIM